MQYRLYDNNIETSNVYEKVLTHRGIKDYKKYLNLTEDVVIPYDKLDNLIEAVKLFNAHFIKENKIAILIDTDPDGYCSAAMMYMYIKRLNEQYPLTYIMHKKAKAHGLDNDDISIPDDIKLIIIPDAGTNDVKSCKGLKEKGIDIIILDHHEKEEDNPYALIVNNQISKNYDNKDLCGAGIVYRFLQALDNELWVDYADDYLDLVALANISDVMDMRSFETKYFVNQGLANINNKCFEALIKAQEFSMEGKITIHNVQWYITPVLNGMIRIGSDEDKELLFKAFIEKDEYFEYKKRATKDRPAEVINESIYDRAARLSKNAKSRQDKMRDKSVEKIQELLGENENDNKVIVLDSTNIVDTSLTGVVAIKIADIYNRPCILLQKHNDNYYGGSARNVNHSPIDSFKDVINEINTCQGKGHANAFGIVDLQIKDINKLQDKLNYVLEDIIYDSTYRVDYILDINEIDINIVNQLSKFDSIIGQGIDEPIIAIENIKLTRDKFEIFGKNEDTISFVINDIKYVMFKCKEDNSLYSWLQDAWDEKNYIEFNIVGKPNINEYNGIRMPQIIIEDCEVIKFDNRSINDTNSDDDWLDDDDVDW